MQLITYTDIFDFIKRQEEMYRNTIPVNEKWDWSMYHHILLTELYSNTQSLNKTDFTPIKNITRPILNLQHRTEDLETKDVQLYVDDSDKYHLSFLVKKYHDDVFTQENDLDTFFDELNVSRIDFGGGLSKRVENGREVVPLQSIAFCDQTDMLSGPIGIKHYFSPDQLLEKESAGWGDPKNGATVTLDELILLSREEKKDDKKATLQTPGKYIEVYEVHGNMPNKFADSRDDSGKYETRLFICAFYQGKNQNQRSGVILYTQLETKSPFKLTKRDPIYGRALGFGGAEELFEPQVWVNYDMIRRQDMLDAAAKTIMITQDATLAAKHPRGLKDMENMEFIEEAQGGNTRQLDTFPRNLRLFNDSIIEWETHAKDIGASQDPIQGKEPSSGTPFVSLQAQIQQGLGLHQYRRGIFAKHIEEIYKDDYIPLIVKKITQGAKWLSELSLEELQFVTEAIVTNRTNGYIKEKVLAGEEITQQMADAFRQKTLQEFKKKGNKHFIEILKGEFKGVGLGVKVNVAGKSKDLAGMVDKLTNVFRTIVSNPYILQSPPIAKLFNKIIEASGLDPIDLSGFNVPPTPASRMTEGVNYKDLGTPPNAIQIEMLKLAGIEVPQSTPQPNG